METRGRPISDSKLAGGVKIPKEVATKIFRFLMEKAELSNSEISRVTGLPYHTVINLIYRSGFRRNKNSHLGKDLDLLRALGKTMTRYEISQHLNKSYSWVSYRCRHFLIETVQTDLSERNAKPIKNGLGVDNKTVIRLYRLLRIVCNFRVKSICPVLGISRYSALSMNQRHVRENYNYSPLSDEEKKEIIASQLFHRYKKSMRYYSHKYNRPLRMIELFCQGEKS